MLPGCVPWTARQRGKLHYLDGNTLPCSQNIRSRKQHKRRLLVHARSPHPSFRIKSSDAPGAESWGSPHAFALVDPPGKSEPPLLMLKIRDSSQFR